MYSGIEVGYFACLDNMAPWMRFDAECPHFFFYSSHKVPILSMIK